MIRPLRLGVVPYLNVLPLLEGLEEHFPMENRIRATPRELAGLLAAGEIDVATLPVFDGLRSHGRYGLVPGAAIACDGPVRSVSLFSKVPLTEIKSVLLDRSSLTSVHLVQILAAELLEIAPHYKTSNEPIHADFDWRNAKQDAFLVIGDVALEWEHQFPWKLDLGEGWKKLTGLPFVFAAWWTREGLILSTDETEAFAQARRRGQSSVADIARRQSTNSEEAAELQRYLSEAIRYNLGPREMEALNLFEQKLKTAGLLPAESKCPG